MFLLQKLSSDVNGVIQPEPICPGIKKEKKHIEEPLSLNNITDRMIYRTLSHTQLNFFFTGYTFLIVEGKPQTPPESKEPLPVLLKAVDEV